MEYIREVTVIVTIDTNKRTIERTYDLDVYEDKQELIYDVTALLNTPVDELS